MDRQVVYRSGVDYSTTTPQWVEEGELPNCVTPGRTGTFICSCGQHKVEARVSADPIDNGERIARVVETVR